jgi:hypothetical protein
MIGDLTNLTCTVGNLDLVNTYGTSIAELNIYEDMESPTGPFADIYVIDGVNALDEANITGNEPVKISFTSNDFNTSASFNMSLMQNVGVKPGSTQGLDGHGGGSVYHKEYTLKCCAPEFVTCQGNYVDKEYEEPCSSIVGDIVTKYFPATVGFDCPDPTAYTRRMIARYEHPLKLLNRVIDDSISTGNQSSLYVLYKNRSSFVYETYENAFRRSSGVTLKMMNTLKTGEASYQDKINSIIWMEGEAFYRPSRPQNKAYIVSYNMATGKVTNPKMGTDVGPIFNVLGEYIYTKAPTATTGVPVFHVISSENNPSPFALAEAKRKRLAFQSHFMQNSVLFCCVGNPSINIGSKVTLNIPNLYGSGSGGPEEQLSAEFCVTAINHKIRGISMTPRYIMICKAIKAAFASEGDSAG